jgi:hypothetical protein
VDWAYNLFYFPKEQAHARFYRTKAPELVLSLALKLMIIFSVKMFK